MDTPESSTDGRVYPGTGSRSAWLAIVVSSLLLLLCAILPFLPGEASPRLYALLAVCGLLFGGLLVYALGALALARSSYLVDGTGICRRRGKSALAVTWCSVRAVDVRQGTLGAGEMLILLQDERGKALMTIPCEFMPEGGRGLYEQVQAHLAPLFLRRAQAYVSGQEHWKLGLIKDVVRLEGRQLFAEYPARRRTAIPLDAIQRVETVPKSRAGALQPAHLRMDHAGGTLRIPLQVPGIHFLPYALKHLYGLADIVDISLPVALCEERDRLAAKLRWKLSCRFFAVLALGGLLALGVFIFVDRAQRHQAQTLGLPCAATVQCLPQKDFIEIRYTDDRGKAHESKTRVVPGFSAALRLGDTLQIRVHPALPQEYWFRGRWQLAGAAWLPVLAALGLLGMGGLAFLLNGFLGAGRLRRRLSEIDVAAAPLRSRPVAVVPPPLPVVEQVVAVAPAAAGTVFSRPPVGVAAACSQCAQPIADSYFLSAGQTWCPACTVQGRLQTAAVGCRPLLLACLLGGLAAAGAAGLWALIVILTGYQLGLVAVVIGILVGLAVRKGSGGTGGRRYQVLAMLLTLAALAYASVPIAIDAIRDDPDLNRRFKEMWTQASRGSAAPHANALPADRDAQLDGGAGEETPPASATPPDMLPAADVKGQSAARQAVPPAKVPVVVDPRLPASTGKTIGRVLLGIVILALAALLGPFILYVLLLVNDPFSLLFLGIALWEAWRFNRPQERAFDGPFKACEEPIDFTQAQT